MKILFTNHGLKNRGGSELFTSEIAIEAHRRNHQVAVFSTIGGPISEALTAAGIPFITDPCLCPFTPDVIHGQHHLQAMAALCAWPRVPALYFVHGYGPWEERPPVHPRIRRYAVPCPAFLPWLEKVCQARAGDIQIIPNFFDPRSFPHQRSSHSSSPRRVLVYHNTIDPAGPVATAIRQACSQQGWSLDFAGASAGQLLEEPGRVLPEYDVIFASGRSALEAMACGAAVIPITSEQSGSWIGPDEFDHFLSQNFTLRPDEPSTHPGLADVLAQIDYVKLPDLAARVRAQHTLTIAMDQLEESWRNVLQSHPVADPNAECRALATYLTSLAAQVKHSDADRLHLLEKRDEAQRRATRWKARATDSAQKLTQIQNALENGSWWHRRLWRRLQRMSPRPREV